MSIEADQVRRLAEPAAAALSVDVEDVVVDPGAEPRVVIVVDADGGVDLQVLTALTRDIGAALDAEPELETVPYTLEVTSPGVDRPIGSPRRWRRVRGRKVTVRFTDGTELRGRVAAVDEAAGEVDLVLPAFDRGRPTTKGGGPAVRRIALADVDRAVVDVEFGTPPEAELALCEMD